MSGFDNEVMYAIGNRLEQSTAQAISIMQKTVNDVSIINYGGNPETAVAANPASMSHDVGSGTIYGKSSGTGNTGWSEIAYTSTGSWTPTVTSDGTPPTITYGVQRGAYVKVGNLCFLSGLITFGSYTAGTGHLEVAGLPFEAASVLTFPVGAANLINVSYVGNYTQASLQDTGPPTVIQFTQSAPSSSNGAVTTDKFDATSIINFSICYKTV